MRHSLITFADEIPHSTPLPDAMDAEDAFMEKGFRWIEFLDVGLNDKQMDALRESVQLREIQLIEAGAGQLFPGIRDLLFGFRNSGISVALAAEARRDYLMAVSDKHELDRFFDLALCAEEFRSGSEDEMLDEIMHYSEVNPSETLVLGTRPAFFQAARNVDVLAIGCGWGTRRGDLLAESDFQSPELQSLARVLQQADNLLANCFE